MPKYLPPLICRKQRVILKIKVGPSLGDSFIESTIEKMITPIIRATIVSKKQIITLDFNNFSLGEIATVCDIAQLPRLIKMNGTWHSI